MARGASACTAARDGARHCFCAELAICNCLHIRLSKTIVINGFRYGVIFMLPSRLRLAAALLVPAAALLLSSGYWWSQSLAHQKLLDTARQAAEHRAIQLASAVAQQTDTLLQMVDVTLQTLGNEYVDEEFSGFLRSVSYARASFPAVAEMQVSINNAQGQMVYSSVGLNHTISVADREYFRFHQRTARSGLFVGEPLLARTTGTWLIPISRPMFDKRGFAGVITIGIAPAYLLQRWHELQLLPRDVVYVIRRDGSYLARSLSLSQAMTEREPDEVPHPGRSGRRQGLLERDSDFDAVHRLIGWQKLGTGDMVAAVGLDLDAVMSPVESYITQSRLRSVAINILLLLVCVLITWLIMRLQRHRAMLQAIYDVLPVGVVVTDPQGHIVDCNQMSEQLLGLERKVQLSSDLSRFEGRLYHADGSRMSAAELPGMRALLGGELVHHEEVGFIHPAQKAMCWLSISAIPCSDAGYGVVIAFIDITHSRNHRQAVEHIAFHDALTGLPNRRLLSDRLNQALSRTARQPGRLVVCFLDLDGFKPVNDKHGHDAGDALLMEIAKRLQKVVRTGDTVARLGGDEFVVVLNGLGSAQEMDDVLERIAAAVATPVELGASQTAQVTASIGVAMHPEDGDDADTLLRYADQAMYRAKQSGQCICHFRREGRESVVW